MPAGRARAIARLWTRTARRSCRSTPPADAGVTIIEVMVGLAIIGTVMAAIAPFMVNSVVLVSQQRWRQTAVQLANDAIERVRALDPQTMLDGRGKQTAETEWNTAPPTVAAELTDTESAYDAAASTLPTDGAQAPLPTEAVATKLNNVTYNQRWYVGRCWQTKTAAGAASGAATACTKTHVVGDSSYLPYIRVVVSVDWPAASCAGGTCIVVASTLASVADDPQFDLNRPPPALVDPGTQYTYEGDPYTLQLLSSGGWPALTWKITGMPAGIPYDTASGRINPPIPGPPVTQPPLATGTAGSWPVTVLLTDRKGQTDTLNFTLNVYPALKITDPADQTSDLGKPVSLNVATATGGATPPALTWKATNLPTGLSINSSTGLITGTPTTAQNQDVTITVTDGRNRSVTTKTFKWNIVVPLAVNAVAAQTARIGTPLTLTMGATGGATPYKWSADILPPGLSMDSAGKVTGTPTFGTRYVTTVTVTDATGRTATNTIIWNITNDQPSDLQVSVPNPASPDQTTALGATVSLNAKSTGGSGQQVWTAGTTLPPGLTISSSGVISGKPTARGTYAVSINVTDNSNRTATLMFTWKVT
ncbi:putative Ig domain-containing protein [Krasilnikovia sp. MM14-A1259]|uniref:putative Ig domain-containing protein n=1 Tax=Krasilnikovia sp. MM14-A1259 TaxID=3373539 RepID=UPI00381A4882